MRAIIKLFSAVTVLTVCLTGIAPAAAQSPLADAARNQDWKTVRSLLSAKADVNAPQGDGATALAWASYWDNAEAANLLIRAGANPNTVNTYGVSPLSLACTNANTAIVETLLKSGANPNLAQQNGQTPLMICSQTGNAAAAKLLLGRGANVNSIEKSKEQTALMAAASEHPEIVRMLISGGADVNARSQTGFTALMFAAQRGNLDSIQELIAGGARLDETSLLYGSALTVASASHQERASLLLLERGADPNIADGNGITPLHYAEAAGIGNMIGTTRDIFDGQYKPRPSNMPGLARSLVAHGAKVNAQIQKNLITWWTTEAYRGPGLPRDAMIGATPFLLACLSTDLELMRILFDAGADPKIESKGGITPLIAAAGGGWDSYRTPEEIERGLAAVKLLVDLGADVNQASTGGNTAMHAAAYTAADSILEFLVSKDAKVNVRNNGGESPWSMASGLSPNSMSTYASHEDTAALLVKLGATPLTPDEIEIVKRDGFRALNRPR